MFLPRFPLLAVKQKDFPDGDYMFFLLRCLAGLALFSRKPSARKPSRLTPFCLAHIVHADISINMSVACPFIIRMIFRRPNLSVAGLAGVLFALRFAAGGDKDERSCCS